MSRGLGRTERAVLDHLARRRLDSVPHACRLDVLAALTGLHRESARRACKTLTAKGYLDDRGVDDGLRVIDHADGAYVMQFYDTRSPTYAVSADYLSTLTAGERG